MSILLITKYSCDHIKVQSYTVTYRAMVKRRLFSISSNETVGYK